MQGAAICLFVKAHSRVRSPSFTQPSFRHTWLMAGARMAGRTKQMSTRPNQWKPVGVMAAAPLAMAS